MTHERVSNSYDKWDMTNVEWLIESESCTDDKYRNENSLILWNVPSELFQEVAVHLNLNHTGRRKTFEEIDRDYYGISRREVEMILNSCTTCTCQRPRTKTTTLKSIITTKLFERV